MTPKPNQNTKLKEKFVTNKQITSHNASRSSNAPGILESEKEFGALDRDLPVFFVYSWRRHNWRKQLKNPEAKTPWAFKGPRQNCLEYIAKRIRAGGAKLYDDFMLVDAKGKDVPWTVKEIHELEVKRND